MVNSRLRRPKDYQYQPRLTGLECKAFIDEEILNGKDGPNNDGNEYFTGQDKLTRVILRPKRKPSDPWYNTVVIPMDDQDIVQGRDLDGQVYYASLGMEVERQPRPIRRRIYHRSSRRKQLPVLRQPSKTIRIYWIQHHQITCRRPIQPRRSTPL